MEKTPHVCCRPSNRQDNPPSASGIAPDDVRNRAESQQRRSPPHTLPAPPPASGDHHHAQGALPEITCDALYVLRFTAARKNEILKLRREQIDLQAKVALIEDHKTDDTDSTRTIQLEQVIDVITRRVAACERDGTRFLFPGRGRTGHLVNIQNAWKRVCERAGLIHTRDLVPHLLRGDFASKALDEGEELRVVQEILGHADIGTTAKYAKCGRDTARRAAVRTAEKMGVRPW